MIRNYLKIALRRLIRQFSYTAINVIGLSAGIASFLLIMMYVQYHFSFDKHIPDIGRWHRVVQIQMAQGVGEQHVAVNMGPLSETLKEELPEVVDAVRVMDWGARQVRVGDSFYSQENVVWTDPSAFRFFGIKLLEGNIENALKEPKSVVLSETVAKKYFGDVEKALGQNLDFNNETGYVVTGIMEDQPQNAHLLLDMLVSYESALNTYPWLRDWGSNSMPVYIKLSDGANFEDVTVKLNEGLSRYYTSNAFSQPPRMYLQPVSDIHLRSGHIKFQINHKQGDYRLVLVFIVIAILIIVIACINFINLAIARSVKRAKEVGVRKVLGANRVNLIYQFLGESVIITFLSIILALILVEVSLPEFNRLLDTELSIQFASNLLFNGGLFLVWVIISIMSGIYPAFFMSRYQAVDVLKGSRGQASGVGGWLSRALVVFQFSVAIVLIFVVVVTNRQINYVLKKDLGYNYTQVLGVFLQEGNQGQKAALLKPVLQQIAGIQSVAAASFINGVAGNQSTIVLDDTTNTRLMVRFGYVDEDFFPLMEIPFVSGRNFSRDFPNDEKQSVILNQAAVNYLGWEEPIGMRFRPFGMDTINKRTVVGVISDYHYYSVHHKIEPAAWIINPHGYFTVCVRYSADDSKTVVPLIEEEWNKLFPNTPFESVNAAARLERQYKNDKNSMKLFTLFTLLSLLISALGLYGLTSLRVEQRTREIGIRKVLGGSSTQMMKMIMKEFLVLVAISGLIALPMGFYFSQQILSRFAYAINISVWDGVLAMFSATLIAMLTILFHALRAANANPVEALKYE
ncbi:MAG: ABC transporter permease [Bacteroidales bacterium]|nr:ABC transporter permease [Bacteroidales bacterium]MDP2237283.1 ABC transporter permease [Bacteroidales bacterium]